MNGEKMRRADEAANPTTQWGRRTSQIHDRAKQNYMTGTVLHGDDNDLTVVRAKLWMVDTNVLAFFMRREPGVAGLIELVQAPNEREAIEKAEPTIKKLLGYA